MLPRFLRGLTGLRSGSGVVVRNLAEAFGGAALCGAAWWVCRPAGLAAIGIALIAAAEWWQP